MIGLTEAPEIKVAQKFMNTNIGDGQIEHTLIGGIVGGATGGSSIMKGRTKVVNNILTGTTEDIIRDSTTTISTAGKEIVTGVIENFVKNDLLMKQEMNVMIKLMQQWQKL